MVDYAHLMAEGITDGMRLMYQIMLIVLVQGTALLMSKYRDFRALFVGISASAFVLGGDMVWNLTLMYSGNVYLAFAVQIAVHCFSMALMIHTVRDALLEEQTEKDTPWLLYSSAPALYYLLAYTVVFQNENSFDHIDVNPLAVVYMILLLLVSLIALAKLLEGKRRDRELADDNAMLKHFAESMKHEAETVRQKDESFAVFRHDMRHYNQMLSTYIDQDDKEGARNLLRMAEDTVDSAVTVHYCSNVAVNSVLAASAARAVNLHVKYECLADVPGHLNKVNEYELAAVIANLSENAITAASDPEIKDEERIVKIVIQPVKAQLAISVSNPYDKEPVIDKTTDLPKSEHGEGHGYGMRSVQRFAVKNNSIFRYSAENHVFEVNLLISI